MQWNIPNQLTVARIFLAAIFFLLTGFYVPETRGAWLMGISFVLFVIAGITDILDGYLARKWNQTSAFGRMVDPICDKVLIAGAFAMLAGPDFLVPAGLLSDTERSLPHWLTGGMSTCIQPWMVVIVLAREFVISGIRGYSESLGKKFPANPVGKVKMLTQSVAIGAVLFCLAWTPKVLWTMWVKILFVWLSVLITAFSGLYYMYTARKLLRHDESMIR